MSLGYRPYYLRIEGKIEPLTAFHIGSGQNFHTSSDSPLLRLKNHPAGGLFLPASSLRGVLRAHLESEAPLLGCTLAHINNLFGEAGEGTGTYGRLRVFDANPIQESAAELRDHVRINSVWGAADDGAKFDLETGFVKQGFSFCANYEGNGPPDPELRLLHQAISFLQSGEFRIGAKSGWGLGRMKLGEKLSVREYDRSTEAGLSAYLQWRLNPSITATGRLPNPNPAAAAPASEAWNTITIHLTLQFEGPVLVKSAIPILKAPSDTVTLADPANYWKEALRNTDATFVTTIDPCQKTYYLPGSSLRGVLRHEAMWIAGTDLIRTSEVNGIFGVPSKNGQGEAGLIEIEDGSLASAPHFVSLDHVAIDRIVQGAADGKKFDAVALESPQFNVRLNMRFKNRQSHLVRWLGALLEHMKLGRLWAGSATSRGYGLLKTIHLNSAVLNFTDDLRWDLQSSTQERPGRKVYTISQWNELNPVWVAARNASQEAKH